MGRTNATELQHRGLVFLVRHERDDHHGEPWKESDGHGRVTDWEPLDAGLDPQRYRPLVERHSIGRYYDWEESLKIATRDKWGLSEVERDKLAERLHCVRPTDAEITERAVQLDYEFLRGWCQDDWWYIAVVVQLQGTTIDRSLWGIESNAGEYLQEVARELADQIIEDGPTELQGQIDARAEVLARLTAVRTSVRTPESTA